MPAIMDVPHLSLALLLEFLGVTVAPLLCSSALGLTPLSSIDRFFFALCCLGKIPGGAPFSQLLKGGKQSREDRP